MLMSNIITMFSAMQGPNNSFNLLLFNFNTSIYAFLGKKLAVLTVQAIRPSGQVGR